MEVPPMIPFIGWLTEGLLGDSVVAVRFFPAIVGSLSVFLVGSMVREMGGRKTAQLVAVLGFVISPVFLGTNNLFQPVSFNQFWWLVLCYLSVRIVNGGKDRYWYALGVAVGLAILTKYSIAFLVIALCGGILISPHRRILWNKKMVYAMAITLVIFLPNMVWQVKHDFPVVHHMAELASSQLVNMSFLDFLVPQGLFHFGCGLLWVSGLIFVFINKEMKPYRYLGWTYVLVFALVLALDGKAYYIFGIYSTMYALGGLAWERWMGSKSYIAIVVVGLLNAVAYPYALPILKPDRAVKFMAYMKDEWGMDAPLRWETGKYEVITQDFADMLGWQELPEKVAKIYHGLSEEEKSKTMIYGESYGHAGVINLKRKKYNLPEAMSFSSSFVSWVKEDIIFDRQIYIGDSKQQESQFFNTLTLMDSIDHPLSRDRGYIYYRTDPKVDVVKAWKDIAQQLKKEAGLND
jgi:hypothetical protein